MLYPTRLPNVATTFSYLTLVTLFSEKMDVNFCRSGKWNFNVIQVQASPQTSLHSSLKCGRLFEGWHVCLRNQNTVTLINNVDCYSRFTVYGLIIGYLLLILFVALNLKHVKFFFWSCIR